VIWLGKLLANLPASQQASQPISSVSSASQSASQPAQSLVYQSHQQVWTDLLIEVIVTGLSLWSRELIKTPTCCQTDRKHSIAQLATGTMPLPPIVPLPSSLPDPPKPYLINSQINYEQSILCSWRGATWHNISIHLLNMQIVFSFLTKTQQGGQVAYLPNRWFMSSINLEYCLHWHI
jgi:hypothetical protein